MHPRPLAPRFLGALAVVLLAACGGGDGDPPTQPQPTPAQLQAVTGGTAQSATVGTAVGTVPSVRVVSNLGQPMAGVTVAFAASNGGAVGRASAQTDAQGVASPGSWTLGTTAGANTLTATVGSLTAQFQAAGTPGAAAAIAFVGGGGQSARAGSALPQPLVVEVKDVHGNRVPNATVTFAASDGGTVAPATTPTTAEGRAQATWSMSPAPGPNTLTATVGSATATAQATATAPAPLLAASVDTDGLAQCAVTAAGQLFCWGRNTAGLIGDGTLTFREAPIAIAVGGATVAAVDVGFGNTCALTTAGAAWCWGLGPAVGSAATGAARQAPSAVAGGHVFTKIAVGISTACGLKANGEAWCWGGTAPDAAVARATPTLVSTTLRFQDIGAGARTSGAFTDQACGIATDGSVYCWGITGIGDPAQVTIDAARVPTAIGGTTALVSLSLGRHHACGLTAAGAAWCWGQNDRGQVGDGTSGNTRTTPVAVAGGHTFARLAAGGAHSCGVTTAGALRCWGANDFDFGNGARILTGVLGNGTTSAAFATSPAAVVSPAGLAFAGVAAGTSSGCAIATNGEVLCWGQQQTATPAVSFVETAPVRVFLP